VILGAQARDTKLLDLHFHGDLHSHLATNGFNRIIRYILNNMSEQRARIELHDLLRVNKVFEIVVKEDEKGNFVRFLTQDEKNEVTKRRVQEAIGTKGFVINKKTAKDIRDTVKNAVYGSLYGATGDRIGTTLSIAKDFGQMFLDSMIAELPIAFGYLKMKAAIAIREGYVIFNNRSNSRHIFNSWQEANKWGKELSRTEIGEITRKTMNYIISGTQADMIKEGMVEVDKYFKTGYSKVLDIHSEPVEHKWIFQVHDELVFDHKGKEHAAIAGKILTTVAGYYLNGLAEMGANVVTLKSWTK
jgi:DNA polymerase I-like protein with 3'-5' exonuclease and polymerase domains